MNHHERNITMREAVKKFGVNYEGKYNTSSTALKRYSIEMRKYIPYFSGLTTQSIYTEKEVEVLRYIKRRTIEGVSIPIAAKDAVSIFYEIVNK
ncbi:hypothetical protein [Kurthia gibsonii]|uniref:hypothetical protein n=1 Tax=Kurthia gibsonii TaxID=33946 RepID=UPI0031B72D7C